MLTLLYFLSTVTLSGGGTTFRGFILQARLMADDTTLTGSFSDPASGTQLGNCTPSDVNALLIHLLDISLSVSEWIASYQQR